MLQALSAALCLLWPLKLSWLYVCAQNVVEAGTEYYALSIGEKNFVSGIHLTAARDMAH